MNNKVVQTQDQLYWTAVTQKGTIRTITLSLNYLGNWSERSRNRAQIVAQSWHYPVTCMQSSPQEKQKRNMLNRTRTGTASSKKTSKVCWISKPALHVSQCWPGMESGNLCVFFMQSDPTYSNHKVFHKIGFQKSNRSPYVCRETNQLSRLTFPQPAALQLEEVFHFSFSEQNFRPARQQHCMSNTDHQKTRDDKKETKNNIMVYLSIMTIK